MRRSCTRLQATLIGLAGLLLVLAAPAGAALDPEKYELESISASLSTHQAGAHADFTTAFKLADDNNLPYGLTRDIVVSLPPGMIGNPRRFPSCSMAELGEVPEESTCPQDAQVGVTEIGLGGGNNAFVTMPIFNMETPPEGDIVARFGLFAGPYPALINVRVDPRDYSLIAAVEGAPAAAALVSGTTTFWGIPAAPVHDALRLTPKEGLDGKLPEGGRPSGQPEIPFLSNPTDCSTSRQLTITAISYQAVDRPSTLSVPFPKISGCEKLSFNPRFSAVPTNPEAWAPTGLETVLEIPQNEAPKDYASSALKSATVTLPAGLTINPSAADGLLACSAEQVGFGTAEPPSCPAAAKIGSVEFDVPALKRTLHGSVYQRTPEPGNLFRFWVATDEQGVRLKLPAEIQVNPLTGQLSTVFSGIASLGGNPQVPFEELRLSIFGGPRAPLATAGCGTYSTRYEFVPWSGRPATTGGAPMSIVSGCGKGGFSPRLAAGTLSSRAGSYSPFVMTLTRQDGEANPAALSIHLPQGLLAKLGGVPLCPEAAAVSGGCPDASRIGSVTTAAGVGGAPLWLPQPGKTPTAVYLAGPYKGAPYSLVAKVPAQAGPFDLGTVVNRSGIYVDPSDATATIKTDPLPQILEGVPVSYRVVHVNVDRPNFTLNPTSCREKRINATVMAANGATASPSAAFKATNCAKLRYGPRLKLRFKGSTKRTGNPGVQAILTQPANQANTAGATVLLPKSQFIDNSHIESPCTRVQFNAEACPKGSILGRATAVTPLLDEPLRGNVYFRSNGGERQLPDIVADLRGPFRVVLVGYIDSVRSRVRTRFLNVPDAPVTKFTMNLFAGKRSLIENSRNLCQTGRRAKVVLTGQNGVRSKSAPRIAAACRHR